MAMCAISAGVSAVSAQDVKPTVVYINGDKFYICIVSAGDTLYSISRRYGVEVEDIVKYNPTVADGLRVDATLKIPVVKDGSQEDTKRRRDYKIHTVSAGETLYSISRTYSVSVGTLMEDNPDIAPAQVPVGAKLYIRKSAMGAAGESQPVAEPKQYHDNLNLTAPEGYIYYVVREGDTLYSLAGTHNTTPDEIIAMNAMSGSLRAGDIIKLPEIAGKTERKNGNAQKDIVPIGKQPEMMSDSDVRGDVANEYSYDVADEESDDLSWQMREAVYFQAVKSYRSVHMALMLPLSRNGAVNSNFVDFYRGFLLGLQQLKSEGISADVSLYDTEQDPDVVTNIVYGMFTVQRPDIIIGPVYENTLASVVPFAEQNHIPLVSPLASLVDTDSRVLFQMPPGQSAKYDKASSLFDGSCEIVLVYGQSADKEFEREVLSVIDKHRHALSRAARDNDASQAHGLKVTKVSVSDDMVSLLRGKSRKVFVIMSDREAEVDRAMSAIASAEILLKTRERTMSDFVVLGNPKWTKSSSLDRAVFFNGRVVFLSSYTANRDNERVRAFDEEYISEFDMLPTPYAYRGYDAAVIFGKAMYGDIENGLEGMRYVPLQTGYTFGRGENGASVVNREWMRTNYKDNYTIEVE